MATSELWFKVQTKDTGLVLYRGTDYNDVVGKCLAAFRNGWNVEVKQDDDWGKLKHDSATQFVGVGSNPATIGATYELPTVGKVSA